MTQQERKKNAWIEHVQKYAKDNNVPYGIAIKQAKETYKAITKVSAKRTIITPIKEETDFQPTPEDMIEHNIVAVIKTKKKNKK
jgi:hypothetical protein